MSDDSPLPVDTPAPQHQPSQPPRGRLAPSPTGAQHVGNARTYLLAWLSIRAQGGRLIVRMEDIDSPRIKPGAARQALDDLAWLGLDWDEGPDVGGPSGPYVQTERLALYRAALASLQSVEAVYPCTCTRHDVAAAASAPHVGQEGPIYAGACAARRAADVAALASAFSWRLRTIDRERQLDDRVAGLCRMNVARDLGDFVVARRDDAPAYQLAVVVDDRAMGVTEVLRGDDLLPSAFRQVELYERFGWTPPRFAHVPLVVGPDGRRLAKRHGDTRLAVLREAGVDPRRLIGLLAWSCGWIDEPAPIAAAELLSSFTFDSLPREPFVFTPAEWNWLLHGGGWPRRGAVS